MKTAYSGTCILVLSVFLAFSVVGPALALSPEQKKLFNKNILYYDLEACGSIAAAPETDATTEEVSGDVQQLAKDMLANSKITYWTNDGINTRDVVVALSEGKKAYTTAANAPNKEADINANILKFIIEVGKTKKIMVNALTDKKHDAPSSNHYKGLAVDLDSNAGNTEASVAELNKVAAKYGGVKNIESNHHHYDFTAKASNGQNTPAADKKSSDASLYMLGDSITLGAKHDLEAKFKQNGIASAYINGSESRSIGGKGDTAGQKTSGLEAADDDKARIKSAGTVVIALGTNPEGNFEDRIKKLVEKVKSYNSDAKIYWVNVFSTGGNSDRDASNKVINKLASGQGYKVIDLLNVDIELDGEKLHPTPRNGNKAYAAAVVSGIDTVVKAEQIDSARANCQCKGGGVTSPLSGKSPEEKVWNFFIDKGLKPAQVAGIMSNIDTESGFNPLATQKDSKNHKDPYEAGDLGWGIIQWSGNGSSGRSTGDKFMDLYKKAGLKGPVYELATQLELTWKHMQNDPPITTGQFSVSHFKTIADSLEAAQYFGKHIEGFGIAGDRFNNTKKWLAKYGSGGGESGVTDDETAIVCTDNSKGEDAKIGDLTIKKLKPALRGDGGSINPKGITLHWWGGEFGRGIKPLADILRQRGLSVQFGITSDGEVYQLTPRATDRASHATGGNSTTFGIEIEGAPADFGKAGIEKYPEKFEAVVALVQHLKDKYNIPVKKTIDCDNISGIVAHKDLNKCSNTGKPDIDDYYFNEVIKRLR